MTTKVWQILEESTHDSDSDAAKQQRNQMYTDVVTLYHEFRPRYPETLIDNAIRESPMLQKDTSKCKVLEIGCGPGTLTLPLAKRGFDITTLDPGVGMLNKCKEVCSGYQNVIFHQLPFQGFQSDVQFDTIFAGTSLHWAISGKDQIEAVKKLHSMLKDDGKLILFWAYPPEPSEDIRNAAADALGVSKPFYFGSDSQEGHEKSITERVHKPLTDGGCFEVSKTLHTETITHPSPKDYISFLKTLSPNIIKGKEEAKKYFDTIEQVLVDKCGQSVPMKAFSSANIISKLPSQTG
uniref:Methyltransferase domain-containing protein n=1 Tax=Ditylum brightwellii TaxID=49249 RepID=A0A6V2P168_9STRA|mmetsp:Transcript_4078/g.5208  ORF Transcript_4078/g.5208 Transcript_4078/m.5208 type:complete len:294 (-) Transcript_4078:479-1360(-)